MVIFWIFTACGDFTYGSFSKIFFSVYYIVQYGEETLETCYFFFSLRKVKFLLSFALSSFEILPDSFSVLLFFHPPTVKRPPWTSWLLTR